MIIQIIVKGSHEDLKNYSKVLIQNKRTPRSAAQPPGEEPPSFTANDSSSTVQVASLIRTLPIDAAKVESNQDRGYETNLSKNQLVVQRLSKSSPSSDKQSRRHYRHKRESGVIRRPLDISTQLANEDKINQTIALLNEGEEKIELYEQNENLTLILGNTGAGKTTFLQWIAGDNSKLIATEKSPGVFNIEDGNRISTANLKSKTLFPELVVYSRTNSAFYDCPGFMDTRGTSHDIAVTYFIKKVADHAKWLKLIFIVSYSSLEEGGSRDDFKNLLRHGTNLVKNIDKY